MSRWFAINDEGFKVAAHERRSRDAGGSTVTVYATTKAMLAARGDTSTADDWHNVLFIARQRFELARDGACEGYLRAVFPERYEGFDEI